MSLPKLNVPSLSVPRLYVPRLKVPRLAVPTLEGPMTIETNPIQPKARRHVKDLGDIILGNPITGTRQLRETLIDYGRADLIYTPILNRVAGLFLMGYERTWVPLKEGKLLQVGANNLESLGRSLDIVANPVKALMPWAGGGSITDLYKSMGWIDSQYRESYDYDTGNWLADVLLETISDPVNWVTWGTKALSKATVDTAQEAVEKAILKKTGKALIGASDDVLKDDALIKDLTRMLSASTADPDDELVKIVLKRIEENRRQLENLLKDTPLNSELHKLRKSLLNDMDVLLKNDAEGVITDLLYDIRNDKGFRYYRNIRKAELAAQNIDKGLLYTSLGTAPAFGAPALVYKTVGGKAYDVVKNKWLKSLKKLDLKSFTPDNAGNIFKDSLVKIIADNTKTKQELFDKFEYMLQKYNLNSERLHLMYLEIYDNLKGSQRTHKHATEIFRKRLLEVMPDLKYMYDTTPKVRNTANKALNELTGVKGKTKNEFDDMINAYQRQMNGKPITPDDLDELVEVLQLTAQHADELSQTLSDLIIKAVDDDFDVFLKDLGMIDTPINRLHYAVTRYMQIDGKQYSLKDIERFIADLNETNPEHFAKIMMILDYFGITVDSAKKLSHYFENTVNYNNLTGALNKLKTRLSDLHRAYKSKGIALLDANFKQLEKYLNDVSDLLNSKNISVDKLDELTHKIAMLLNTIEETPGSNAYSYLINRVRSKARTVAKLNKMSNRTNYTTEILDIIRNNKTGNLPVKYGSDELQRVFRNFQYDEPKVDVEDLTGIRKKMLGHAEAIEEIDDSYIKVQEFQTKFMEELTKITTRYRDTLDDVVTLKGDHVSGIITELNSLDNYAGLTDEGLISELTPEQLIHDLFAYELTTGYDLKDFDTLYESLKRRVKSWRSKPEYEKVSNKTKQFIDDLNELFVDTKSHELYTQELADLLTEKNRIYYMMLRKSNHPAQLFNAISRRVGPDGTWSEANKEWFAKLLDPQDDSLRKELLAIASVARDYNYGYLATDIEHILASLQQLQAYAAIEQTLRTKYTSKLSKEQCNYIINLIYNELMNSKLKGATSYTQGDLERFMRRYKQQYYTKQHEFVERSAIDIAKKNGWIDEAAELDEYFKNYPEEAEHLPIIKNTAQGVFEDELDEAMAEAWDAMRPTVVTDSVTDYITNFDRELMADIREAFSTYLATLNYIAQNTNARVTVQPMVNYDYMMNRIKELAADYAELRALITDQQSLDTLDTFIGNVGGSQVVIDVNDPRTLELLDKVVSNEDIMGSGITPTKLAPHLNEDDLFTIMRESFRDISTTNIQLAGKSEFVNVVDGVQHMKKFGLVTEFIDYTELDNFVTASGIADNIYDYTLANDFGIAFKKYTTPELFRQTELYNNVADTTGLYRQFVENYRRALAFLDTSDKGAVLNKVYLNNVRQALIEVYLKSDAPYAPKDAIAYFKNLSDIDLRAWDMVTRVSPINEKVSVKYNAIMEKRMGKAKAVKKLDPFTKTFTLGQRIDYNEDPMGLYKSLEEEIVKTGFIEEGAFKEAIDTASYTQFANIREYVTTSFKQWVKDPDTLLANSYNITQHIKNNVDAWENIRFVDRITQNKDKVKLTTKQLKTLERYGITADTSMNDPKVLRHMTRERSNVLTDSFKTWGADDIRSYLDYETQGLGYVIYVDDFSARNYRNKPYLLDRFTTEELTKAGIEIHQPFKEAPHIFVIRKAHGQLDVRPRKHKFIKPDYVFKNEQEEFTKLLESNRHYYEYGDGVIHPEFYTGEVIDLDTYTTLSESEELTKVLGDLMERKSYSKASAKGINNNFVLNTFIIGSPDATNELYSCMAQRFQDLNKAIPYHSNELPRMIYSGTHTVITRANNTIKYLELFFNQDYYLGADHFVKAFENASDTDIADFFKRGNFVAMVAKEAKDGSPAVYKFEVFNRKTLQQAIEQGAVAVPYEVYRNAVLAVNKKQLNAKLFNIYRRTIVGTFKTIYLTTAGFLMRNELDSAIYKNAASTEGVTGLYDVIKYQKRAWDVWKRYSDIQKAIIDSTKKDVDSIGTLNKRVTRSYLSQLSKQERNLYMMVDIFVNSSASGGYSEALQDLLLQYNTVSTDLLPWEKVWNETILNGEYSPARWVMDINSQIEQTSRLALFLKMVDETGDYAKAIKEVVSTHFDYELKEPGMELIEDIFWFSTFPINNMAYYLNEGLTRNPDIFKLYMDMLERSWNGDDITWDDVRNNSYYAYNALRGNLRFKVKNKNIVLKTSSSVMDYLSILYSPFEEAKQRLNPFASVLLGIEPISELNPTAGIINRATQLGVGPGKSLIPSVYMELYPNKKFNYQYNRRVYNQRTWTRYPKKVYGVSNQSYVRYNFITNAYAMRKRTRSRLWLTSTTAITPNWYHNNYRLYKVRSRLIRAQRKLKLPVYKT